MKRERSEQEKERKKNKISDTPLRKKEGNQKKKKIHYRHTQLERSLLIFLYPRIYPLKNFFFLQKNPLLHFTKKHLFFTRCDKIFSYNQRKKNIAVARKSLEQHFSFIAIIIIIISVIRNEQQQQQRRDYGTLIQNFSLFFFT